jgi:hypothetical protein
MSQAWFRLYAEFATDPKVQMMNEVMQRRLIMLFCLRCSDVTVTASDDEIAFQLRISSDELTETKELFIRKGFIDKDWNIVKWDKRQFASDSSAARTRAYRDRQRNDDVTSQKQLSDALEQNRTEQIQRKDSAQKRATSAVTFKTWIESIPDGEHAIPPDDPVYVYAERVGLPEAYLRLEWAWFKAKYAEDGKRQKSWPQKFRNAVEGGWGNLWRLAPDGQYFLTTQGQQLERSLTGGVS